MKFYEKLFRPISQAKFAKVFWSTHDQLEVNERPAYFSFLALMAYKAFVEEQVDVMIMEVGIGGKFCATNVYPPSYLPNGRISCITALGYDHMSILGDSIEEIATNKCGIIHPFTNLVFCQRQTIRAAQEVVQKFAPRITDSSDLPPGAKLGLSGTFNTFD